MLKVQVLPKVFDNLFQKNIHILESILYVTVNHLYTLTYNYGLDLCVQYLVFDNEDYFLGFLRILTSQRKFFTIPVLVKTVLCYSCS